MKTFWFCLAAIFWVACSGRISRVIREKAKVVLKNSQYGVLLRDVGSKVNRKNLYYGFIEDRYGAQNMYQFNSLHALRRKQADVVWLFSAGKECVPNSAVVYNNVLYCRLFTTMNSEYNNDHSKMHIQPVTIAAFGLSSASTKRSRRSRCQRQRKDVAMEAKIITSVELFSRMPNVSLSSQTWLDKFDLRLPSSSRSSRPNMNARFHVDATGMWLLLPYQPQVYESPKLRRLRIDPVTLKTRRVICPITANVSDTTEQNMFGFGIGVMVDSFYYGLSRNGEGDTYFRQGPSKTHFSDEWGPYRKNDDSGMLLLENAKWSVYASNIQYSPVSTDILVTLTDTEATRASQHEHVIFSVDREDPRARAKN